MACFADINVSQGSVAIYARCSGIFNIYLTTNLPRTIPVIKNWFRFDRTVAMSLWPTFLPTLYTMYNNSVQFQTALSVITSSEMSRSSAKTDKALKKED